MGVGGEKVKGGGGERREGMVTVREARVAVGWCICRGCAGGSSFARKCWRMGNGEFVGGKRLARKIRSVCEVKNVEDAASRGASKRCDEVEMRLR